MKIETATQVSQRLEAICRELFEMRKQCDAACEGEEREWYRDQIYLAMKVLENKVLEQIYREHPHLTPPELESGKESPKPN